MLGQNLLRFRGVIASYIDSRQTQAGTKMQLEG